MENIVTINNALFCTLDVYGRQSNHVTKEEIFLEKYAKYI